MNDPKLIRVACPRKVREDDGHAPVIGGMFDVITEAAFRPKGQAISAPYCAKCGAALVEVDAPAVESGI